MYFGKCIIRTERVGFVCFFFPAKHGLHTETIITRALTSLRGREYTRREDFHDFHPAGVRDGAADLSYISTEPQSSERAAAAVGRAASDLGPPQLAAFAAALNT